MPFKWVEENQPPAPAGSGFRFLDQVEPPSNEEIEKRFSDPEYNPSLEEFRIYRRGKKDESWFQPGKWAGLIGGAAEQVVDDIAQGAKAAVKDPVLRSLSPEGFRRRFATASEAFARGTFDLIDLGRRIVNNVPGLSGDLDEDQFQTKEQFEEYKLGRDFERFLMDRAVEQIRQRARSGKENLLPLPGESVSQPVAEAGSLVADPSAFVPGLSAGKIVGRLGSAAMRGTGAAVEALGRGGRQLAEMPGEFIQSGVNQATGTPFETFSRAKGAIMQAPFATLAGTAGAVEAAGQAARAAGEAAGQLSQFGILERIAKDSAKPGWLRKSASLASQLGGDAALRLGGRGVTGALEGAAVGGGLGFLAGGLEGAASGIGAGGVLGAGAGTVSGLLRSPSQRARREEADLAAWVTRRVERGSSPEILSRLNRETALAAATAERVFGGDLDVLFVSPEEYALKSGDNLGAAFHAEINGRHEIVVNVEAMNRGVHSNFLHELGHALFKSPVVDRGQIASAFYALYGEAGVEKAAAEYARKLAINEKLRDALSASRGSLGGEARSQAIRSVTPEQVEATRQRLSSQDPDWVVGELFAEHFLDLSFGESINKLRAGPWRGASADSLLRPVVAAKAKVLSALGVPLSPTGNGALPPVVGRQSLFEDFRVRNDPKLARMIRAYFRDRDRFLSGLDVPKDPAGGARVTPRELASHPAAGWQWNARQGYFETDFAIKTDRGEVILKPARQAAAAEQKRVDDLQGLFPKEILANDDTRVGPKRRQDGGIEIRGEVLPDAFFALESFGDETKRNIRMLQDSMRNGELFSTWYQAVGTGSGKDSWAQSVRRGLGNLRVSQRDFKPLHFHLSKQGNLLVTLLDVTSALRKMVRWQVDGKLNDLWGGDLNSFRADLERYLKNHADGLAGDASGIGIEKRNKLNAFFAVSDKASLGFNPLRAALAGPDRATLVKSFRVDRMQSVRPAGSGVWWFDYVKQKRNMAPEAVNRLDLSRGEMENTANETQAPDALRHPRGSGARSKGILGDHQAPDARGKLGGVSPGEFVARWVSLDPTAKQGALETHLARAQAINSQEASLLRLSDIASGRKLLNRLIQSGGEGKGGDEHRVFFDKTTGRVYKSTHPGRYGGMKDTPIDYLRRMENLNRFHPDLQIRVVGVVKEGSFASILTEMAYVEGDHPGDFQLAQMLNERGWKMISGTGQLSYRHGETGVTIHDAHPGNYKVTPGGALVPIDIIVEFP